MDVADAVRNGGEVTPSEPSLSANIEVDTLITLTTKSIARFLCDSCVYCVVCDKCPNEVQHAVCFQIQRDTGLWYSVEYSSFSVGPETDKYRLSVSAFSGDTGDAIAATVHPARIADGMKFTTQDQDNDNNRRGNCAVHGGWWYNWCSRSRLNIDINAVWNADTDESIYNVVFARMLVKLD